MTTLSIERIWTVKNTIMQNGYEKQNIVDWIIHSSNITLRSSFFPLTF